MSEAQSRNPGDKGGMSEMNNNVTSVSRCPLLADDLWILFSSVRLKDAPGVAKDHAMYQDYCARNHEAKNKLFTDTFACELTGSSQCKIRFL